MTTRTAIRRTEAPFKKGLGSLRTRVNKLELLWQSFKRGLYSQSVSVGMAKELEDAGYYPPSKIEFELHLASQKYILEALYRASFSSPLTPRGKEPSSTSPLAPCGRELERGGTDLYSLLKDRWYHQPRYHHCYAVVAKDGDLCGLWWMLLPQDLKDLPQEIKNKYAGLKDTECILESGYIFEKYRGIGMLPAVVRQLGASARSVGFKRMLAWVPLADVALIADCHKAGFQDFSKKTETRFLFRTLVETARIKPSGMKGGLQMVIPGTR